WLNVRKSWECRLRKTREDSSSTRNRCTSSTFSISARGRRMCICAEYHGRGSSCREACRGGQGVRHQGLLMPKAGQQPRGGRGCLGASADSTTPRHPRGGG